MNVYVIRQSAEASKLLHEEIKNGRVRQGWSFDPSLTLNQTAESFGEHYAAGGDDAADGERRFAILRPMRSIRDGDVVIVPKQPTYDHFLVATARAAPGRTEGTSYEFGEPPVGSNDFRHVIHVDPTSRREFHFDGKGVPSVIKQKLRSIAYGAAVNTVSNTDFIKGIKECLLLDGSIEAPEPQKAKLAELRRAMYRTWVKSVRQLTPLDFEKLVRTFMEAGGYQITRMHRFDGEGKDVDIECSKTFEVDDPLGTAVTMNYRIQVKKHVGQTGVTAVRQLLDNDQKAKVGHHTISIVISTGDDFTDDAKTLAASSGIALMNGIDFARAYFRSVEHDAT